MLNGLQFFVHVSRVLSNPVTNYTDIITSIRTDKLVGMSFNVLAVSLYCGLLQYISDDVH